MDGRAGGGEMRPPPQVMTLCRDVWRLTVTLFVLWPLGIAALLLRFLAWPIDAAGAGLEKAYLHVLTWITAGLTPQVPSEDQQHREMRNLQMKQMLRDQQEVRGRARKH